MPDYLEIDEKAVQTFFEMLNPAFEANTADKRKPIIGEMILRFGPSLFWLMGKIPDDSRGNRIRIIEYEALNLYIDWLSGKRLTDRNDEDARRAIAAKYIISINGRKLDFPRMRAVAMLRAISAGETSIDISDLPDLAAYYKEMYQKGEWDDALLTASNIIQYYKYMDLESDEFEKYIEQGLKLIRKVDSNDTVKDFCIASWFWYCLNRMPLNGNDIPRDEILWESSRHMAKIEDILFRRGKDDLELVKQSLYLKALRLATLGFTKRSIHAYEKLREISSSSDRNYFDILRIEGLLRSDAGDFSGAEPLLKQVYRPLLREYLVTVNQDMLAVVTERLGKVAQNLAACKYHGGNPEQAFAMFEETKSARFRFLLHLQRRPDVAQQLREIEQALIQLTRGSVDKSGLPKSATGDIIGEQISTRAKLLEQNRQLRNLFSKGRFKSPSIKQVVRILNRDEAIISMGLSHHGLFITIILSEANGGKTVFRLFEKLTFQKISRLFFGTEINGWCFAQRWENVENKIVSRILNRLLANLDRQFGQHLIKILNKYNVKRLVYIPHLELHMIPLWAMPSLRGFEYSVYPSVDQFILGRRKPTIKIANAVIVGDPTLDLPDTRLEAALVKACLRKNGIRNRQLIGPQATEAKVFRAMANNDLFHYAGHSKSENMNPLLSALFLYPDLRILRKSGYDSLREMAFSSSDWIRDEESHFLFRDIPNIGRLYAADITDPMNPSDELRIIELRLESDKKGTLWCNCENPDREIVSELLTAGDILTSADSLNCSLVFLASCEAGQGALNTYLDESAGLPAALVESGISSIISPLWQLPGEICLLYVDKFYQSLFERKGKRRLSEIVSSANDKMRQIKKSDVIAWIDNLRYNIKDGTVRFRLEAWKNNLASMPNYPYMDPYYSSAFFVTGGNRIVVE